MIFWRFLLACMVAGMFLFHICYEINLLICSRIEAWVEEIFHHLWSYQEVAVLFQLKIFSIVMTGILN